MVSIIVNISVAKVRNICETIYKICLVDYKKTAVSPFLYISPNFYIHPVDTCCRFCGQVVDGAVCMV